MTRLSAGSARVVVVGTSGCGKTTFAESLSSRLNAAHVELDAIHWGPNWTAASLDDFRAKTIEALTAPAWVCDGNYSEVRELVWARANTLVWLDYSFALVFYRAVTRTLRRLVTREELFGGNRESWRLMFRHDWIPWWVLRTFRRRRLEYGALIGSPSWRHLEVLRFTKPRDADAFLETVRRSVDGDHGQSEGVSSMIRLTFMTDPDRVIGASTPEANAFDVVPPAVRSVMERLYTADHVAVGGGAIAALSSAGLRDSVKFIINRNPDFQPPAELQHVEICTSYLDLVERFRDSEEDLNVIGGLTTLQMFLHHADRLAIAETTDRVQGDLVFDEWVTAGFEVGATEGWEGGRTLHAARPAGRLAANKRSAMALYDVMFNWNLPRAAARLYVGDEYRQHNPHVGDGIEPFIEYFERMAQEYPGKRVMFKRAIAEGNHVALHCHQHWPGDEDYAGIDIFRFDDAGRIVEHWDVLQTLPEVSANERGMF